MKFYIVAAVTIKCVVRGQLCRRAGETFINSIRNITLDWLQMEWQHHKEWISNKIRVYHPDIANRVLGREVNGAEVLTISCTGKKVMTLLKIVSQVPTISLKIHERKKEIYITLSQKEAFSNNLLKSSPMPTIHFWNMQWWKWFHPLNNKGTEKYLEK